MGARTAVLRVATNGAGVPAPRRGPVGQAGWGDRGYETSAEGRPGVKRHRLRGRTRGERHRLRGQTRGERHRLRWTQGERHRMRWTGGERHRLRWTRGEETQAEGTDPE